jgi:hypothetical protein
MIVRNTKVCFWASFAILTLFLPNLYARDSLLMHFDFKNAGGKTVVSDITGKFKCKTECGKFKVEYGALRIAVGAKIKIPVQKNFLTSQTTMSAWVLKEGTWGYGNQRKKETPILNHLNFYWGLKGDLEHFYYNNGKLGIIGLGTAQGSGGYRYPDDVKLFKSQNYLLKCNQWEHIAVTFDNGLLKLYLNGELLAEKKQTYKAPLIANTGSIYIGAIRLSRESISKVTAEMLINDIRIYSQALDDRKIKNIYADAKEKYPMAKITLLPDRAYYSEEMLIRDPDMQRKLPMSVKYEANLPVDPYKNKREMKVSIKMSKEQNNLFINNKKVFPFLSYASNRWTPTVGLHRSLEMYLDFAAAGMDFLTFCSYPISRDNSVSLWIGDKKYNWHYLDYGLDKLIKKCPKSKIIITLYHIVPQWFRKKYPDEFEQYYISDKQISKGKKNWKLFGSLASDIWDEHFNHYIKSFIEHVEKKYGNHVAGYLIGGGDSGEWYWQAMFSGLGLSGYSERTRQVFIAWLKNKYKTNPQLRKAWGHSDIKFGNVQVPSPTERKVNLQIPLKNTAS